MMQQGMNSMPQQGMMGSPMVSSSGNMMPQQGMMQGGMPQQGMMMQGGMQQGGMGAMPQQQGMMMQGGMPQQGMMMQGGMPPQGGMGARPQGGLSGSPMVSPAARPAVVATKTVVLPIKVSSHHVNNTSDVEYDIEISIEESFPDGSKAVHKHKFSESIGDLKKIHEAVYHGELVKDRTRLSFPHQGLFERKESDKKVAERMAELKVYFDAVFDSPKAITDKTFLDSIHVDKSFELNLRHAADYMKLSRKAAKKQHKKTDKAIKKVEKEEKKDLKKADKYSKKEDKYREEQYHRALKQQVYTDTQQSQFAAQPAYGSNPNFQQQGQFAAQPPAYGSNPNLGHM